MKLINYDCVNHSIPNGVIEQAYVSKAHITKRKFLMSTDNEPNAKVATEITGETTAYFQFRIIPKHQWIACFRTPHATFVNAQITCREMRSLVVVRSLESAAAVSVDVVGRNFCRRSAYAAAGSDGTPSRLLHLGFRSTYLCTQRESLLRLNRKKIYKTWDLEKGRETGGIVACACDLA